jgi:hypothetical protein
MIKLAQRRLVSFPATADEIEATRLAIMNGCTLLINQLPCRPRSINVFQNILHIKSSPCIFPPARFLA